MLLLLFVVWIILNGRLTPEIALIGLFVTTLIYAFMVKFLNASLKNDLHFIKLATLLVEYFFVLCFEIIKANLNVIPLAFAKRDAADPAIVEFDTDLKSNFSRVLLANSITLTPGTITIDLTDAHYTIHALRPEFAEGISESRFVALLRKMEAVK